MYKSYRNFNNSQESKKLNHTGNITKIEEEQDSDDQELEDDMKISACLEQVDLVFYDKTKKNKEYECFALAYLNNRKSGKIKSVQAMPCNEIEKTMAYWTSVNDVKGMRFIPNPQPPIQ